ncbi:MAG TPA: ABC transporter substrate-binding protein [Chloroflexota bacterium]|nr:ABC transporter substrate-binding protein [Chloroflexota bacterium]
MRTVHLGSTLAAVGMLLAACGGGAAPASSPASSPATASPAASKPAAAASAGASAKPAAASGAASASAKPAASGAATGTPYKFGVLSSATGPYASLGVPVRQTIELEAKRINDAGGVDGHPIQLVIQDDETDPSKGVIAFKKILDEKPIAQLGPVFSSTALAIIPLEEQAKIPAIHTAADPAQVNPLHKNVFMDAPRVDVMVQSLSSYMQKQKISKIAILHDQSAYGAAGPKAFKDVGPKFGVDVIEDEIYNTPDTDMTAQLTKIKNNSQVQALMMWGSGAAPVIIAKEFKSLGFNIPILFSAAEADGPGFVQPAGAAAEGVIMNTNKLQVYDYLQPNDPSKKLLGDFIPAYKAAVGKDPNEFSANAYDAIHMMVQAILNAKSTDSDKIVDALEHLKFDGADGTYQYSPTDHAGMQISALTMVTVKDGKLVPTTPNCDGCFDTTVTKG